MGPIPRCIGKHLSLGVELGTVIRHLRVSGKPQDEGVTHRLWSANRLDWGEPDGWQLEGLRAPSIKRKPSWKPRDPRVEYGDRRRR